MTTPEEQPYVSIEEIQVELIRKGIPPDPAYFMARQERRIWDLEAAVKKLEERVSVLESRGELPNSQPPRAA
jgi:hypothetical protein